MDHSIRPVGHINTPFSQKFAIPRQAAALSLAKGTIEFEDFVQAQQACVGLEHFSHLWLLFIFHENLSSSYKPMVRPPRLGGNEKIGVFASRSSFRANNIGMSVVKNEGFHNGCLYVSGVDLLHMTPIVDIKPYLPYADSFPNAAAGFAQDAPNEKKKVSYSESVCKEIEIIERKIPEFSALLSNILAQDPRPAYKHRKSDTKIYKVRIYDIDVSWQVKNDEIQVLSID